MRATNKNRPQASEEHVSSTLRAMADKTLLPRQVGISDGAHLGGCSVAGMTDVADVMDVDDARLRK